MTGKPLLDSELIYRRRLAAGLTQRALALQLTVTYQTIRKLESGTGHGNFTLMFLTKLADVLGVTPAQLWLRPGGPDSPSPAPAPDDIKLEALLVHTPERIRPDQIATALGWELPRALEAINALRGRLDGTGERLIEAYDHAYWLKPEPSALTDTERRAITRAQMRRSSITVTAATQLHAALTDQISNRDATAGVKRRAGIATLVNAGILERDGLGLRLSDETAFSLGLT